MRSLAISAASKSKSSSAAKSILAVVQKRCISAKTPTCKSISSTTTNTRPAAPSSLAGLAKSAATTPAPARRAFASHATKFQSRCAFNTTNSNTIHAFRRRFFSQYIDHFASSSIEPFDFVNEETLQHFPWAKLKNCYTHLENRCVLCVEGEDAAKFLQGLITNDINAVTKKDGIFAMMLNSKGRVLYEVLIFPNTFNERIRRGEGEAINSFLIECDRNLFSSMRMHLMKYKLRSKVNFVDYSNTIRVHAVMGPDANSNTIEPSPTTITFADPRLNELGVRMYSMVPNNNNNNNSSEESNQAQPAITLPAQFKQFPQAPQTVYNALRIMLGVPEGNEDLPSGDCFPLESNLDLLHGVSFHKGCYLGQELTARTHHSGVTRKRIVPAYFVRSEHDIISPETMGIIPSSGTTSTYASASASASVPTHHKANTAFTPSLVSSAYFAKFRVMDETQFGPDAHLPPPGSPIKSQPQEKQVGKLCSHVFNLALCLLRTDEAFGEPEKSPRLTCEGFIAVPVKPFWLEQHEARERAEREERERLAAEAEAAEMAAAEQEEAEVEGEEEAASATTATARA